MYRPEVTYKINGCLFDVYNSLGNIWDEETYENSLEMALNEENFQCQRQVEYYVYYYHRRVGKYRMDLLINNEFIIELKAVPEILLLHKAQIISYLKGTQRPVGLLVNFGHEKKVEYQYFPNKFPDRSLTIHFDKNKTTITDEFILMLLELSKKVLEYHGPGYYAQVYKRSFSYELNAAGIAHEKVKLLEAKFRGKIVGKRKVNFLKIGNILYSPIAVSELNENVLNKFVFYLRHTGSKRGLIVNFNSMNLSFRYFDNIE